MSTFSPWRDSRQRKPSHFGSYCHSAPRGIASTERASMVASEGGRRRALPGGGLENSSTRDMPSQRKRPAIRRPLSEKFSKSRSDRSGDPLLQLRLRRGADLTRGHLAALEDHQGRDRHHAVFRGRLRALVDIQLHDLDLVAHGAGNLVERGSDHAAGAAPFGPEIEGGGGGGGGGGGFEIGVRNLANGHGNYLVRLGIKGRGIRIAPKDDSGKPMNAILPGQAQSRRDDRMPARPPARG